MSVHIEPGSRIGPLAFEREIGRGAFAVVWLARDTLLDRRVAVKVVLAPVQGADRDRMLAEARLVARLRSPHVVTIHGVHPLPGGEGWLLEMEYAEEGSLQGLLDRGAALDPARARAIARGVVAALADSHAQGVVHGDVKPANVLLGRGDEVKLTDFGLSWLAGDAGVVACAEGRPGGTPNYMAPEVAMGERAGAPSDVWSAGVLLYRLATGRLPFEGRTLDALFFQIQHAPPEPPGPEADPVLAAAALRCLEKDPATRAAARDVLAAIDGPGAPPVRRPADAPAAPLPPPPPPAPAVRLRGRDAERARISAALDAVAAGAPGLVVVTGEAGAGKTAILRDTAHAARRRGFRVIEGVLSPLRGVVPPLLDGLRHVVASASTGTGGRAFRLDDLGSAAEAVQRTLAGAQASRPPDRQEAGWAAEQVIRAASRAGPVAVVLDDAQHADAEDARLVRDLVAHLSGAPVLVALAARPPVARAPDAEGPPPLQELLDVPGAVRVEAGPLDREELFEILCEAAAGARLSPEVAARILDAAAGNPLFALEFLRHVQQTSGAAVRDGVLAPGPAWKAMGVPRGLRDLVALRLDRLPDGDRDVLDVASVDGLEFDGEALAAVLGVPLLVLLRRLQAIMRRGGLLDAQESGYRFAHPLVRDVLYGDLAPDLRRELHLRLAEHLAARGADVPPERLGLHWERAGDSGRAGPCLARAAVLAARRQEYLRAIDLATRARVLGADAPPAAVRDNAELLFALAGCYSDLARPERAAELVASVAAAAESLGDDVLRARSAVWREDVRYHDHGAEGLDVAALEAACAALPRGEELGRAHYVLGSVAKHRGDLALAAQRLESAHEVFAAIGLRRMQATTKNQMASVALREDRLCDAERLYREAAAECAAAGRRTNAAISDVNRAVAALAQGRVEGLEAALRRAVRTLTIAGAVNHAAQAEVVLAQVLVAEGDAAEAGAAVDRALAALAPGGFAPGIAMARIERARLAMQRGDLDAARADVDEARAAGRRAGDRDTAVEVLALEARCAAHGGDVRTATVAAQTCVTLLRAHSGAALRARTLLALAEAALYGLPAAALGDADAVVAALVPGDDPAPALVGPVLAAARAASAPEGGADALRGAAAAIRSRPCGERRRELLLVADRLEAEARVRDGDASGAAALASSALRGASLLGHVWLEMELLRLLHRADPEGRHGERLASLARVCGERLSRSDERRRVTARGQSSSGQSRPSDRG